MEKSVRIMVIIQLCLAFTLICWIAGKPFSQDHLSVKARANLYQFVMGTAPDKKEVSEILVRNQARFNELSTKEQQFIKNDYKDLHEYASRSFLTKMQESFQALVKKSSPFVQAWIFFSIVISLLMLFKIEGVLSTVWILPFIAILYAGDNFTHTAEPEILPENALFPSETVILNQYAHESLSDNIFAQKTQLLTGWHHYLVKEWSGEKAGESYERQIEQGEFAFTVGRLTSIHDSGKIIPKNPVNSKENLIVLMLYICWNSYFAWFVNKKSMVNDLKDIRV